VLRGVNTCNISFETALAYYGLIPESVYIIYLTPVCFQNLSGQNISWKQLQDSQSKWILKIFQSDKKTIHAVEKEFEII